VSKDDVLFGYRLQLFDLAGRIGVSAACRSFGIHRSTYYRWRAQVERHGLEVLRDIRQDAELSHTRVVAITAGNDTEDSVLAEGADRLLRKPFEAGKLRAVVEELAAA